MSNGDLLSTSISGLLAYQRALSITGHNVANVNTPGFSRQRADMVTRPSTPSGDGYIGNGVSISTVQRVYDAFVGGQLTSSTAANGQLQEFYRLASEVDHLLANPNAGLSPALQDFFQSVHDVANDPSSVTARQVMLSQGQSLADRFRYLDQRLTDLRQGVNTQIRTVVDDINSLASTIATTNRSIVLSRSAGAGQPDNDLLDQRDQLINDLASKVSVRTVLQDDGSLNVFIGKGQALVAGFTTSLLTVVTDPQDISRNEVAYVMGANTVYLSDSLSGGTLGGTLDFRRQVLDVSQNELGRVANAMVQTVNSQHRLGMDLYGSLGTDFFSITPPPVLPNVNNAGAGSVAVAVTDATQLTTSDYSVTYNGPGSWSVLRLSDSNLVTGAGPFVLDGLTITPGGAPAVGDSFLVQPNRVASGLSVAITDTRRIAAAGPLRTTAATDVAGTPTNFGNGRISAGEVAVITGLPLAVPITLTFDPNAGGAGVPGFTVGGGPAGPLLYDPLTENGGKQFTLTGYGDFAFTMSGVPQTGDNFIISNNTAGVGTGDNRNALHLADLQTQGVLGGASFEGAYGRLVADVGTITHKTDVQRSAQQVLYNQAKESRDSVSGVNLDEEAANMLRFQQAYQAAAQMITTSGSMFQSLIAAIRG